MIPYSAFILLYIILFSKDTADSSHCLTSVSDTDHVLARHVMRTLNHKSFESCTFSCELEPQCFSVNYISLRKTCQLNDATKEYFPGDLMKQKGAFYMVLQALGMESGAIPNANIGALSEKTGYEAWRGRLNGQSCWMPANNKSTEFITVTFAKVVWIVAIATQGAPMDGCWVKSFSIEYGAAGATVIVHEVYQANSDKNTVVTNTFSSPLYANWIRIFPSSWSSCIALRIEVYGYQ